MDDDENKEKQCVVCGKLFIPSRITQICCNKECYKRHKKEYDKQWRQENKEYCQEHGKQYYQQNKKHKNELGRQWYQKNKKYCNEYSKQWRQQNGEYHKEYSRQWRQENKERCKECENNYKKQRRYADPNYKMSCWCREQIHRCLRSKKTKHTFDILDYTPDKLRLHLESQFKEDMSWDNHGTLWHIDHIKPLCSFNFLNEDGTPNYDVVREANSLDNLQPLYVEENLSKGGKIN